MTARFVGSAFLSSGRHFAFIAPLLSAAIITSPALAEQSFAWADGYPSDDIYRAAPVVRRVRPQVRPSVLPKSAARTEKTDAEGKKPQGPLVIAISIQRQQVKVYDANGLFAESPISSGMAGHPTPMGVFSVIQKHKFHHSNIYSGAPMPYMQRITWSGVAMHAGVLPGYPASHGCIRLPMSFAMKMWGWTKMGARVVVTPAEVSPADFAHPTLATLVPPPPVAAAPIVPNVRTADASNSMVGGSKVMADIATDGVAAKPELPADVATVASIVAAEATMELASADSSANDGLPSIPAPVAIDLSDVDVPVGDAVRPAADVAAQAPVEATDTQSELAVTAESAVTVAAEIAPPVVVEVATPAQPEPAKDQAQITAKVPEPDTVTAVPLIKRNLPVAIFVSRKDGKIYVRQNFTPVLDMPIEITSGDKALGTHVFTARPAKDDDNKLQWSVVSLPAVARQASAANDERSGRRRNAGAAVPQISSSTPDEALARLTIPSDLMARLGDALPAGSSLVVSDQGIAQGETGEGTDFIVRLR